MRTKLVEGGKQRAAESLEFTVGGVDTFAHVRDTGCVVDMIQGKPRG